jgi:hypothetical protein
VSISTGKPFHHHAVQFYGTDLSLFGTVSGFLADGLVADQPALVIATAEHASGLREHLTKRMIDITAAEETGQLQFLDAADTLGAFMVDGSPDAELFDRQMGAIIEAIRRDNHQAIIRAYGEMVDLLWRRGDPTAAIQVEILWNKLALKYRFALMCGYSMGSFYKQTEHVEAIFEQHTDVILPEQSVLTFKPRHLPKVS